MTDACENITFSQLRLWTVIVASLHYKNTQIETSHEHIIEASLSF